MKRIVAGALLLGMLFLARAAPGVEGAVAPERDAGALAEGTAKEELLSAAAAGGATTDGTHWNARPDPPAGSGEGSPRDAGEQEGDAAPRRDGAEGVVTADPGQDLAAGEDVSGGGAAGEETPGEEVGEEAPAVSVADPIEPLNRVFFVVNDRAYYWVFKPVARGYEKAVPAGARRSIGNFFGNLAMPIRFTGHLLQGKLKGAGIELTRFVVNSTLGVAGLFDAAAEKLGLRGRDEDLGQAFGAWGLGHGFYVVLPLLGPSSFRDAAGLAGESTFLDPLNRVNDVYTVVGARVIKEETRLTFRLGAYEALVEDAIDPYAAVRDAYVQYRAKQVRE